MKNPEVKFRPPVGAWMLMEKAASLHSIGYNGDASVNELMKLWFGQICRIPAAKQFIAMASLAQYQSAKLNTDRQSHFGPKRGLRGLK